MVKTMSRKLSLALLALLFSGVMVLAGCDNTGGGGGEDAMQQPPQDDTQGGGGGGTQ